LVGGYGSGRRPEKYNGTVEECRSLDISEMLRRKWIVPGRYTSGIIEWKVRDRVVASITHEDRMDLKPAHLRLYYTRNETNRIDYKVGITTTRPNYGGLRYWFICPSCSKRTRKLYFLGGQGYFLCRTCQGLTYRSCRESHKLDAIIAKTRQPGQSRAEALRSLKEFRETLLASWGYRSK